jgi:hypothetical protein
MIIIPLAYATTYVLLSLRQGSGSLTRVISIVAVSSLTIASLFYGLQEAEISSEYSDYAATILRDGLARSESVLDASVTTVDQSGLLGSGIGSATQGSRFVLAGERVSKAWQEDGVSRLFKELGVPGVLLLAFAGIVFVAACRESLRIVPDGTRTQRLQMSLFSVAMANFVSFIVSHQQYSGDPMTVMFVTTVLGMAFGAPRLMMAEQLPTQPRYRPALAQRPLTPRSVGRTAMQD